MSVPDTALLRAAMEVVLTWGPERMTPEIDRLSQMLPNATEESAMGAISIAHQALQEAESYAESIKLGREVGAANKLCASHPWLTSDLAERAISQGLYFHWRDTGM